nr:hypothetical protein [Tanacetum cinerariifolium]
QEDDENNHSNGNVVKRGITMLYKFRKEYGKPNGIKLSVTFDALNRISGKYRALSLSFLGDMVRKHIGLKILSWKKRYFDVELIVRKLVKSAAAKMARSKFVYQHTMGRGGYALVKEKMKETEDKIKERTLKVDHGTDAMTVVLCKEKGGYARGMGSGVTYKSADEEGGTTVVGCENDASIQKSNRLATLEKKMETRVSNKTPPCETVKSVGSKKMTRSIRKDSSRQDSQSQENVSPLLVLPQAIKCKLWHFKKSTIITFGTVYKTDGKQMLHNKEIPKDCYKVSIDTSLVDASCIPYVGNNGFKTVKDAVGGFFSWPKDQVVFDPKATPPSTIQMNVGTKLHLNYKRSAKTFMSLVMQCKGKLRRRVFRSP